MLHRILVLLSLVFPAMAIAEEIELICSQGNSGNRHEIYVLYQKQSTSYAYLNGKKHGFGIDFWEYEKVSENQRNVYSAYYGSDELIFWRKHQILENEQWKSDTQQRFHVNRITGTFELSENDQPLSKGECQLKKVKKL
jgi:hypothetical protein